MFDKLVVSTTQRRRGRTAKFFVFTSSLYSSVVGLAFALSVLLASPKLADTASTLRGCVFLPPGMTRGKPPGNGHPKVAPQKDLRNFERLETVMQTIGDSRPMVARTTQPPGTKRVGEFSIEQGGGVPGISGMPGSTGRDMSSGNVTTDPPKPPDPPKPQPRPADKGKPLAVSSIVLQGKAIDRVVPIYPELPKRIRLHGDVSTEVIISPEGRVESVRVVSGHPMLVQAAVDAARRWRFEPTILNGVAVRVTGVITFVFKLNE